MRNDEKLTRFRLAKQFVNQFKDTWEDFRERFVTCDETWLHLHEHDTRESGREWRQRGEKAPKKFKIDSSPGKILGTFFLDMRGIIFVDFLPHGHTITGQYYAGMIRNLREQIKEKRRGMLTKGVLFLHDNARVHTCGLSMATINDCGFELIQHAPYSPDLAPSDYYLFRNLQEDMRGKNFKTEEELKSWIEA